MPYIKINHDLVCDPHEIRKLCPFDAIDYVNEYLQINAGCKMCGICIKKGPSGVFTLIEENVSEIDKSLWNGIAVFVDHLDGEIHPVTFELLGKAREMAGKVKQPVLCLFAGHGIRDKAKELLFYGADDVHVYDNEKLKFFRIEPYTAVFEDFITKLKPSVVLVGGTTIGRSLAPRVAARFRTGLTADCTILDIRDSTDLDQVRPAFGGNIMAHIHTPNHRPQFATVRYRIFSAPERSALVGKITECSIDSEKLASGIEVLDVTEKEKVKGIEDADVIVVAGRAIKKQADLAMIKELADLFDGHVAATRPLIEAGWADPRTQIGLSGRTVSPRLLITCGVSGAIQFRAGMGNAEHVFAINKDPNAPIFDVAHYGMVGDVYEIVPALINKLRNKAGAEERNKEKSVQA